MRALPLTLAACLLLVGCVGDPGGPGEPSPSTPPAALDSPPATLDPEAELERVIALREDWGLRSDRGWVGSVDDDPAAVMSELGILVTPDEQLELQRQFAGEPRSRLIAYGARNHDTFGGLWMDGRVVMMCFVGPLEPHRRALDALATNLQVELLPCRHTQAALETVMRTIDFEALRREGFQLNSMGLDTINNVVRLEVKSNLPNAKQLLEARYGEMLVADVYPIPGAWANNQGGNGWRLMAAGIAPSEGYVVRAATDEESWQALWRQLDPVAEVPLVDLTTEVVVSFGHGIGSSCQEVRLDGVVIDHARGLVFSATSDPLAPRACTADLIGGAYFVVALARETLPASPFTVQLVERLFCESCDDQVMIDLP